MEDLSKKLVESLAGNDKGKVFVVLKTVGESHVLYADGRKRGAANPKLKKIRHIRVLGDCGITDIASATNAVLRKATAAYVKNTKPRLPRQAQPTMKEG